MSDPTNKTFTVNDIIRSHRLHCILLTETWLDETGSKELTEASPSNFSLSHCTRSNKRGGGVAAIFTDGLLCKSITFGSYSTSEYLALVIRSVYPSLVLTVYHPPKQKKKALYLNLVTFYLKLLFSMTQYLFLVISTFIWITPQTILLTSSLICYQLFDFIQHIAGPNQCHTSDLVISKGLGITPMCTLVVGISHHLCIFVNVAWIPKQAAGLKLTKRRSICVDKADGFL